MKLEVLPLTRDAFRPYGDVIETEGQDFFHINDGKVQRFHDLAMVETLQQDRTLISINRAQPAALPIIVTQARDILAWLSNRAFRLYRMVDDVSRNRASKHRA